MSPKLKNLSGTEVVAILEKFGFEKHSQRGSHIKMRRQREGKIKETLTIPFHKHLDKGTIRAIFRQACMYVPEEELRKYFYSED